MTLMFAVLLAGCTGLRDTPPAIDLTGWRIEAESPQASVRVTDGVIDIDTPKGLSLWFARELTGPVVIRFEAMAVSAGGPNDAVSDLNAFWMATDREGASVLARPRNGAFADYDTLKTYYVGIGGNRNTTTRFRRYIGETGNRPLLPDHDLAAPHLLTPNVWTRIALIADGGHIAVMRDGKMLFRLDDPAPYTRGHFAIRTTQSHLRIRHFEVSRP